MTYSRLQNPTVAMLEERIALMEGAEACRVQATGMAAMTTALLCQLSAGDHIVAAKAAFGSCRWLLDHRSEERRVGNDWVRTCYFRWSSVHSKNNNYTKNIKY